MVRVGCGLLVGLLLVLDAPHVPVRARLDPAAAVPTPAAVLGFEPGQDYTLADFTQLQTYFARLAGASPRVRLGVAGRSTEGRDMLVAVISSEANLARLDHYQQIARRLAIVRGLSPADARALAREGKAIVWIDNGLHASEVATAQHALVLAHRVATDESPEMRAIRDNVILVLLPCINPDGMQMVVDWYRRTLRTPHQDSPMPWLYQKYVGHDNNRDSFMLTQAETRVVNRLLYFEWLPQIMYNQHQGTWPPRMFVPPFPDPVNPNIDPAIVRAVDLVGGAMLDRFGREQKDGVISRYQFSIWYNGSVRTTTYFHNIVGILTETGHDSATPHTYHPEDFPPTLSNGVSTTAPSVTYPQPWKGGTLRLRDAMDYMLTGSLGVLEVASRYRERFLHGIYEVGARQIEKGRREAPFAYIVRERQHDPGTVDLFLQTLIDGAVEVHAASAPFIADGRHYPAGTRVVLLSQPFRAFAKDLIEPQHYPDVRSHAGGPPIPPYDVAGWTLAYQMGVALDTVAAPFDTTALVPLTNARREGRFVPGPPRSRLAALDPRSNGAYIAVNRLLARGVRVERAAEPLRTDDGEVLPVGTWLVEGPPERAAAAARPTGTGGWAITHSPAVRRATVRRARVGLYKSWVANIDEGWTRWLLERHEFPFTTLTDTDLRAGGLSSRFDVVVLPDQSARRILRGHTTMDRPSTPGPWNPVPPEYQGGIGDAGVKALRAFVERGGTLVTLDEASELVLDQFGGVFEQISNPIAGLPRSTFYCPGSVLRIAVGDDVLASGMAREAAAYFIDSRAFETADPRVRSLARYAAADRLLMSGWLLGGERIAGKHAAVEVPHGRGRVVMFGFRPQFRAQSHDTFKLLFNALYVLADGK